MTQYKQAEQGNRVNEFEIVRWYIENERAKVNEVMRSLDKVRRLSY